MVIDNNKKYYDIRRIRTRNARFLSKKYGGQVKWAFYLDKSQGFLSCCMSDKDKRTIGFNLARELEQKCNLPYGWMDNIHDGINYD